MARGVQKHTDGSFFLLRRPMNGRCSRAEMARGVPRGWHAAGSFFAPIRIRGSGYSTRRVPRRFPIFGHHRHHREEASGASRHKARRRNRHVRRLRALKGLEDRVLLSRPTVYTVDLTSDSAQGSGTTGDIACVLYLADQNPNPAGSLIEFSTPLFSAPQTITLDNTIIAQNSHFVASSTVPDDIAGTLSTYPPSTFNLIGTGGAGGLTNGVNGNQVGVASPGLASGPAYNGGPTETIALLPGSPAIDAGSNALDGLPYDQRGLPRIYNGTIDIGAYEFQPALVTAVTVHWGTAGTASLQTTDDGLRLLPAGRNNDLPWYGIDSLQITFDEPVALTSAEVSLTEAKGTNYGPATITGSGETYTIMLSQPIDRPDRVTIMTAGTGIATYTRRLDVLPGDVNDDGVVNAADASSVKSESRGRTPTTIFDEILGSGMVQTADYKTVKKLEGKAFSRLPRISSMVMARVLARERLDNKHEHH